MTVRPAMSEVGRTVPHVSNQAMQGPPSACGVVELRQYLMQPGQRDELIMLFEREFLETQEDQGMAVLGTFRDLDRQDWFVWLRGFAGMASRHRGLEAFYRGPVWARHRTAANATMIDSDDVLLLRPLVPYRPLAGVASSRPAVGSAQPQSLVVVTIWPSATAVDDDLRTILRERVDPMLAESGSTTVALLETEPAVNTFPGLPVREGEHVLVRIARYDDVAAYERHLGRLAQSAEWPAAAEALATYTTGEPTTLRLEPTPRSILA